MARGPLTGATLILVAAAGGLALRNGAPAGEVAYLPPLAACAIVGGLLTRRRPGNPVGPLLLGSALCFALLESCGQAAIAGVTALAWPQTWLWVPANLGLALVPAYFPDGRLPRGWRFAVLVLLGLAALAAVTGALRPGVNEQVRPVAPANPLGVAAFARIAPVAETLFTVGAGLALVAGAALVAWQTRALDGVRRQQARWLAFAAGLVALVVLARLAAGLLDADAARVWPPADAPWDVAGGLSIAAVPAGVGIAVLRHRLFDIDLLISRAVVFVALSAAVAGAYLFVVGVVGASSVLAAVAGALVFGALRQRLQRRVNVLVYGERDDPYTVLTRLGERRRSRRRPHRDLDPRRHDGHRPPPADGRPMSDPIRVLIVDDHDQFRAGLRTLLATAPELAVVAEAATGEEALTAVARLHPDVVLLDLAMPGMGGIAATERIVATTPHVRVLVLSMAADDDSIFAAMRAGARGYVLKGARRAELLRSIHAVAEGEAIFGPSIATRLTGYFAGLDRAATPFPELTSRERQILALIARHLTNPQIAERLGLSQKTVRNHVSNIFAKLQVADRAQAISLARDAGLPDNPP